MFVGTAPAGHALGVLAVPVQGHQAGPLPCSKGVHSFWEGDGDWPTG